MKRVKIRDAAIGVTDRKSRSDCGNSIHIDRISTKPKSFNCMRGLVMRCKRRPVLCDRIDEFGL